MPKTLTLSGAASLGLLAPLAPAAAQASDPLPPPHADHSDEIIVTGLRRDDALAGTSVIAGEELARDLRTTIGETLARQPGVSATSFGPNASRPVLRGFQGERVRVLTDGIGSLDASNTSVDHAVAINPLTADRIEVLRGPSALLFGSSAIGGVVNVIDARIPRRVPADGAHAAGLATYGSAANERSLNAAADLALGKRWVLHADGNYAKTGDLRTGGAILARPLREAAAASADPAVRALADVRGRLANTAAETSDFALGAAWIGDDANAGLSVKRYDSRYGVPLRQSLDPASEAEAPRIDIRQYRADGRAEFELGEGLVKSVRLRGGWSDYRHVELEDSGEVGTSFVTEGAEFRAEAVQDERRGWGGGFGGQYFRRSLDVAGEEKFLPPSRTSQIGLFGLQSLERGPWMLEAGARYERQTVSAAADADLATPERRRRFDAVSGSLGATVALPGGVKLGLSGSHSQRAPAAEELFANGPHAGTQAFEVGNPRLALEKAWGLEATLRAEEEAFSASAAVFGNWFDGYIFERATGELADALPVFRVTQGRARYFGLELEGSARLARLGGVQFNLDGVLDLVRATIVDVGPAPRIPPLRLLGGVEAQAERFQLRLEVERTSGQLRVAAFETPTRGFTLANASLAWHPLHGRGREATLLLSANNLFDVVARRHASFLKDFAPLAGRDVRATLRLAF
ncbi:MAG: TonB-dependent receptor [Novosphingobium sp.]